MLAAGHPSYPNPTIREALCEVRFEREGGWAPDLFSRFAEAVRAEYPVFEPVVTLGVQVDVAPGSVGQTLLPPGQLVRFRRSAGGNLMLQLGNGVFSANVLPRYPDWEGMRQFVLAGGNKVFAVVAPARITRVGLRYINLIPVEPGRRASTWLQAGDFFPAAALESEPGFFIVRSSGHSRVEMWPSRSWEAASAAVLRAQRNRASCWTRIAFPRTIGNRRLPHSSRRLRPCTSSHGACSPAGSLASCGRIWKGGER